MPVISNEVTQMTGLAEQPISAQENPSGKSNIDKVFNCLNIDDFTSLNDIKTTYGMFFV